MIAMMTIEVTRMSHMPHPPRWNAVEIVCNMIDLPPDAASLGRGGAEDRGAPVQGQVQPPNDRPSVGSEGRGEGRRGAEVAPGQLAPTRGEMPRSKASGALARNVYSGDGVGGRSADQPADVAHGRGGRDRRADRAVPAAARADGAAGGQARRREPH